MVLNGGAVTDKRVVPVLRDARAHIWTTAPEHRTPLLCRSLF